MNLKDRIRNIPKVTYVIALAFVILLISLSIPTLAKYKNRVNLATMFETIEVWDGTVALAFNSGSGTENDPYVISNAKEFALFYENLKTTDYEGYYFKLSDNILINNGLFNYGKDNRVTYTLNTTEFFIKDYSNEIYDNPERSGVMITKVNMFEPIKSFKGHFDGDYHTIYGLYVTKDQDNVALFNELTGNVSNVYFENVMVYGGSNTAILANNIDKGDVKDIYLLGNVAGTKNSKLEVDSYYVDDMVITKDTDDYYEFVDLPDFNYPNISKVTLKGIYTTDVEGQKIEIDGNEVSAGEFNVLIDYEFITGIEVEVVDEFESNITLTNLVYEVEFDYPITSSLAGIVNNSKVTNVINKANVYGTNSAGIVGILTNTSIVNGYNTALIDGSDTASGLVSLIKRSDLVINVDKFYNTGELVSNYKNVFNKIINNTEVNINDVFNVADVDYVIGEVNGNVKVTNVYDVKTTDVEVGELTNNIKLTNVEYLKTKTNLVSLGYKEFLDNVDLLSNTNNAWIYESGYYPILYFDELNDPIVQLNVGTYSWNDLAFEFKDIYFDKATAFNVTNLSELNPPKQVQYYLHRSNTGLNRVGLNEITEWVDYEGIVSLEDEGHYIIYIKVVDQYDNVFYVDSEHLVLDFTGPSVELKLNDVVWNSYKNELVNYNIYEVANLNVTYSDLYTDVVSVTYHNADKLMTTEELDNVSEWTNYENEIPINEMGGHVIYVRAIDRCGNVTYVNSDKIMYGGYSSYLKFNDIDFDSLNVSNKSEIMYQFTYDYSIGYEEGYETAFITNNKLPEGTIMYLVDNTLGKAYYYVVDDSEYGFNTNNYATYSLKDFSLIGKGESVLFNEVEYLNSEVKDLSIFIDFKDAKVNSDFSFIGHIETKDSNNNKVMSTLVNTYKTVNVYNEKNGSLYISNNNIFSHTISYDSNSTSVINFTTGFNYELINESMIYSSIVEDNEVGIAVKLINNKGAVLGRKYLKNMVFTVDGVNYFADSDGIVRINLGKYSNAISKQLIITTYENEIDLPKGTYNLVVTPYFAYDGKYYNDIVDSKITMQVNSNYVTAPVYDFNVVMNDSNKIMYKSDELVNIPLTVTNNSNLANPNVRISLYKKAEVGPYSQIYNKIDLNEYATDDLVLANDLTYYVTENEFTLSLNVTSLEKTGYELRFELYDGDNYIYTIKKKFILR